MKKNVLTLIIASLVLFSCGDNASGNKSIIPASKENISENITTESKNATESVLIEPEKLQKKLTWTAFKMKEKVSVSGTFDKIILSNAKQGKTLEEVLEGANFNCDKISVNSGDISRDEKLKVSFFQVLNDNIEGSFGKFENGRVPVTIKMDGKESVKSFNYSNKENQLTLNGVIDIIEDFQANDAFTKLHEACKDLHGEKTWTDVNIEVVISK